MAVEIVDCVQQEEAWFIAKLGVPSASSFADVMAGPKRGELRSATRDKYLSVLAAEIVSGIPHVGYRNFHMDRGVEQEDEVRRLYAMMADAEVEQVGFIRNGRYGASPDGLVGAAGMLEIKTEEPSLLFDRIVNGGTGAEHMAQLQGNLMVAEREWIDLAIGHRGMKLWRRRVRRNEPYIAKLRLALEVLCEELDELVEKYRRAPS